MSSYGIKTPLVKYKVTSWLCLLLFVLCYFIPWDEGAAVAFTIVTVLVLLSIVAVIQGLVSVEMNAESIIKRTVLGSYGIDWEEIETIQYCVIGEWVAYETMILQGKGKRLSIPGPGDWAGEQSAAARRWFFSEVRNRALPFRASVKAAFMFSKNVRCR